MYLSSERLMLTVDGEVVPEGDPRARFLLVAKDGQLPDDVARKYGLLPAVGAPPDEKSEAPKSDEGVALALETPEEEVDNSTVAEVLPKVTKGKKSK